MKTLPDKPSEFLTIALRDMGKVRKTKRYILDMGTWHEPHTDPKQCSVCMAGATMAFSLGAEPYEDLLPDDFCPETSDRLSAINFFRAREISIAFEEISIEISDENIRTLHGTWHRSMKRPENNFRESAKHWRIFIKKLKELGY